MKIANVDPVSIYEQNKFQEEKMLIEQDPFLLEEQRYLSRMSRAHNKQEMQYKKHYEQIHAPEIQQKMLKEE